MVKALDIFRLLIKDPDYAVNGTEAVWAEAQQRERQHRNNDRALSLGYMDTPAMKEFIEYLSKADEDDEKPIQTVGEDRIVHDTPLKALRALIQDHRAATDGLNLSGRYKIGLLRSTSQPHIEAIGHLAKNDHIKNATSRTKERRESVVRNMEGFDPENFTGEYDHNTYATLAKRYDDLERDYRGVMAMLAGEGNYRLGYTEYTTGEYEGSQEGWLRQISDVLQNERLQQAERLLDYLPTPSEMPKPEDQMNLLPQPLKSAGMYGIQTVSATPRSARGVNWDSIDFSDEKQREKLLQQGVITEEDIKDRLLHQGTGEASVAQYLQKFGNFFPSNAFFDPERSALKQDVPEEGSKEENAFNEFMRITHWHPDRSQGRRNLWNLMGKIAKRSPINPDKGFYGLSENAGAVIESLSPSMRSKFLDMVMGENSSVNPVNLMNPNADGVSGLEGLLDSFARIDREQKTSARNKKAGRSSFDNLPPAGEAHIVKDTLREAIPKLMADLGSSISSKDLSPKEIMSILDESALHEKNYPYNLTGKPIPGLADVEPLDDEELRDARLRLQAVQEQHDQNLADKERELSVYKDQYQRGEDMPDVVQDADDEQWREEMAWGMKWQGVRQGMQNIDREIARLEPQANESVKDTNPAYIDALNTLSSEATDYLDTLYTSNEKGERVPYPYTDDDIDQVANSLDFQRRHLGTVLTNIPTTVDKFPEEIRERIQILRQAKLDKQYLDGGEFKDIPEEYFQEENDLDAGANEVLKLQQRVVNQGIQQRQIAVNVARQERNRNIGEASIPVIKRQRFNQLNQIITQGIKDGKSFGYTAENMENPIPLTPKELEVLNNLDNNSRIFKTLTLGGDVGKILHGLVDDADLAPNPSLHLLIDSNISDSSLKSLLNQHDVIKGLSQFFNIRINPTYAGVPINQSHEVDVYNPDETRRNLKPHPQEYVTNANVDNLTENVKKLFQGTSLNEDLREDRDFSEENLEDTFDVLIRRHWNDLSPDDRESMIALTLDKDGILGHRPEYQSRIIEGAAYHKILEGKYETVPITTKETVNEFNPKTKRFEDIERETTTDERRFVASKWEMQQTGKKKVADLRSDTKSGGKRRKVFNTDDLLKDFTDYKFADADMSEDEKIAQLIEDGQIETVDPNMGYSGSRGARYGATLTEDGEFFRDSMVDVETLMSQPPDDAPPHVKENYKKQQGAMLAWAKTFRDQLINEVHPLDESHGRNIHEALKTLTTDRHEEVYSEMNKRDQESIMGETKVPYIEDIYKEEQGTAVPHYRKIDMDEEGKALNTYTLIPTHLPIEDSEGNAILDEKTGNPLMKDNPDRYVTLPDGTRQLGVYTDPHGSSLSKWGIGSDDYGRSRGEPDVNKGVHAYISNIASSILSSHRSDVARNDRQEAWANELIAQMEEQQQRRTARIETSSGLSDRVLNTFADILTEWSDIRNADEWTIPENIRQRINKDLPAFAAVEENTKNQEQLDAFLTNVYRQFHRWRSEQLDALTADNLQPELEEDFRQSAQQDTMQYVQDIHDQIDEINERYENLVDENTSEEQGLDLMQKKHEELEALPTSTKREWGWFHRPPWVDKYFNEIFETYKKDNLSELLSDIDAAGQLDTMFASTRPSSIPMEPIHIDQLNYPTGSTHIPANAAGGIDVDDNNEALIKSVPLQLQFPPRRFFQRGSGMYKSIPVPPVYEWLSNPRIYTVVEGLANATDQSIEDFLAGWQNKNNNLITQVGTHRWLYDHGFILDRMKLPETLELRPIDDLNNPSHPNRENFIKNAATIDLIRQKFQDVADKAAAAEKIKREISLKNAQGNLDPNVLFDYGDKSLEEIMKDVDLQENLNSLFLTSPRQTEENIWEKMLTQDEDNEFFKPPQSEDGFDLTDQDNLSDLHRRLGEFLNNFEIIPRAEMIAYREPFSQGAHGFRVKNPDVLETLMGTTGADIIAKGNPIYHMTFEDQASSLEWATDEPEGEWIPIGITQDDREEGEEKPEAITYQWVSAEELRIAEGGLALEAINQIREDIRSEKEQEKALKDAARREAVARGDRNATPPPIDLERASLFSYLSSAWELYQQLGSIAQAHSIELPHLSHRDANQVIIVPDSSDKTFDNLKENPLNVEINGQEILPPTTPYEVAQQEKILREFSIADLEPEEAAAVRSYLDDLQQIMDTFNYPSLIKYGGLDYGSGVKELLANDPRLWENGEFKLYNDLGNVDEHNRQFLTKYIPSDILEQGLFQLMHLLDSAGDLPRNLIGKNIEDENVETIIPEDTSFFVSPQVKQFLQGMAKIAQDNPSYEHLQDFKDFFIDDTLEDFNWDQMNRIFNDPNNPIATSSRLSQWHTDEKRTRLNYGGDEGEGLANYLKNDNIWNKYFPGIEKPYDGRNTADSERWQFGRGKDLISKILGFDHSIITRAGDSNLTTEDNDSMELINKLIDELQTSQSNDPTALHGALEAYKKVKPEDYLRLDESDYEKIITSREEAGLEPVDWTAHKWENMENIFHRDHPIWIAPESSTTSYTRNPEDDSTAGPEKSDYQTDVDALSDERKVIFQTLEAKYKQALIDYNNAVDKELKTATINKRAKKVMDAQEAFDDFLYQEQDDSGEMPEPLVRMPTEEDDFNYIGPSKDEYLIPSWLLPNDPSVEQPTGDGNSESPEDRAKLPVLHKSQVDALKTLYYGITPEKAGIILSNPSPEDIEANNLKQIFADDMDGFPVNDRGVIGKNYFKAHEDFKNTRWGSGGDEDGTNQIITMIKALFTHDLEGSQGLQDAGWNAEDLAGQLSPDHRDRLRYDDEHMEGLFKILLGDDHPNIIIATATSQQVSDAIIENLGDILEQPIPKTSVKRRGSPELKELEGFAIHPHEMRIPGDEDADGKKTWEKVNKDVSPATLLKYGQALSERYYRILDALTTSDIRDQLKTRLGDEWEMPTTDINEWRALKDLLGKGTEDAPGFNVLADESGHTLPNPITGERENSTWKEQLDAITAYIGSLKQAYEYIQEEFPGLTFGASKEFEGSSVRDLGWDEYVNKSVDALNGLSSKTITHGVYDHLVESGMIEDTDDNGFVRIPKGRMVPQEAINNEIVPSSWFGDERQHFGIGTNASKNLIRDHVLNFYTNNEDKRNEEYINKHPLIYGPPKTPTNVEQEILDDEERDLDLTPIQQELVNWGWDKEHILSLEDGGEEYYSTGKKPEPTGDDNISEEKDRRTQLIEAIQAIPGYENYDPGLLEDKDIYSFYKPLAERKNQQIAAGVPEDEVRINGENRKARIDSLNTARKKLGMHELPPETLNNMNDADLDKTHAKIKDDEAKFDQEQTIKAANNPNLQNLTPEDMGNEHAIMQQFRRITNHDEEYHDHMTDESLQQLQQLAAETHQALTQLKGGDSQAASQQLLGDRDEYSANRNAIINANKEVPEDQRQEVPPEYGSRKHIDAEFEKENARHSKIQTWSDYLRGADGFIPEELRHPNRGANVFIHQGEDGVITSYTMDEQGSRMTIPARGVPGKSKGDLVFDNDEQQGGVIVRGGAYTDTPSEYADISPQFSILSKAPKVFGLPEDIEDAYNKRHNAMVDLKAIVRKYNNIKDIEHVDEETMLRGEFVRPELLDEFGNLMPSDFDEEMTHREAMIKQFNEATTIIQNAEGISDQTKEILFNTTGYDAAHAYEAMIADGHNEYGLPVDENGVPEEPPQYMDQSGTLRNRVYHRETKMWYDPEMLDDLRNKGQGSLATFMNQPYDAFNVSGTRLGETGAKEAVDEDGKSITNLYRLGVPAANYKDFFGEDGEPDSNHFNGIVITRTGVHKVGDTPEEIPTMDEEGNLNHAPLTPQQVSQASWELSQQADRRANPEGYADAEGNELNAVTVNADGHFDGGWKEWLDAGGRLGFLEAPGVRSIPGMRRFIDAMQGKPGERRGDFQSGQKIGLWSGPQTYAGRQIWGGVQSTKVGAGEEGKSRLEQVRDGTYSLEPKRPSKPKLKDMWDRINQSVFETTGRRMPGLSANAKFRQFLEGTDETRQNFDAFVDNFRQNVEEGKKLGYTFDDDEVDEFIDAEWNKLQVEGDPRAAAMNVGEGTPAFVRPMPTKPEIPPEQQIIDPTQQGTSAVQTLYDQYGQPVPKPVNPNPSNEQQLPV